MARTRFLIPIVILVAVAAGAESIDEVVAKHLSARGGLAKIRAVTSATMSGKMSMNGMDVPFSWEWKRPDRIRTEFTLQGMTGIQAYDGKTGWAVMPIAGKTEPERIPPEQVKQMLQMSDFEGPLVDWKKKGHSVSLAGRELVEGSEAWKVELTLQTGDRQVIYIDVKTALDVKHYVKVKMGEQELEAETIVGDYRSVDGILIAHTMETRMKGTDAKQSITFEKVAFDVPIDDARFAMPKPKAAAPAK